MAGDEDTIRQLHAVVSGRVQGVGYRRFVASAAAERGLVGYVRNLHNGEVEVLAEGPEDDLRSFIGDLWSGPPLCRVEAVRLNWGRAIGIDNRFRITY